MTKVNTYTKLFDHIRQCPIISSHNHHFRDEHYQGMNLDKLLESTYVNWAARPPKSTDIQGWQNYLLKNKTNSFLRWSLPALEEIYDIAFTTENLPDLDIRIQDAYKDNSHHIDILTKYCRFERVVNERQPNPGDNLGYPELFSPSFRCDCFFAGYIEGNPEPNGFYARSLFSDPEAKTLASYFEQMRIAIERKKEEGCVALKVAMAYERPINFTKRSYAEASAALNNKYATQSEIISFGDAVMFELAQIAADIEIPLQIHTGTGQYEGTNAMGLLELIRSSSKTKFHLLHGGFPWVADLYALMMEFHNVYCDLCWLPYLSPTTAKAFIKTALEVSDCHRITWGCDTWMPEDSLGALHAIEHCLSATLAEMVEDGAISFDYAKYIAERILYYNSKDLFELD